MDWKWNVWCVCFQKTTYLSYIQEKPYLGLISFNLKVYTCKGRICYEGRRMSLEGEKARRARQCVIPLEKGLLSVE